jgi:hypothetical protein
MNFFQEAFFSKRKTVGKQILFVLLYSTRPACFTAQKREHIRLPALRGSQRFAWFATLCVVRNWYVCNRENAIEA